MNAKRTTEMEDALAYLEFEIARAIKHGVLPDHFSWQAVFTTEDGKPWIALLTIAKVGKSQ